MPPTKYPWGYPNLTGLAIPWFDPVAEPGKALASYCSEFSRAGCMVTPGEKDLGPRFGNAWNAGTTSPSGLRLATNTVSLETWGWGERADVGFHISRCPWKKQMLKANAKTVAQGGVGGGCEVPEQIALSRTSGLATVPRNHLESKVAHLPVPLTSLTTRPLRFPTRFPRNRSIPQETKLGIVYDFLFLTQKHLTRFLNTKYRNKNELATQVYKLFGYSVDPIKGHGSPTQNPDTQSRGLSRGDSAGHPAEAHLRSAAGRPLLQLQ